MTTHGPVSSRRRRLLTGGAAGAALLGGVWLSLRRHAPDPAVEAFWAQSFETPQGGRLDMSSLRGRPLLVNFWATWCAPCVRELPEIDRFHRDFGARGWQVVGLAIDGPTPVREFLARMNLGFPIGLAGLEGTALVRRLGNERGGLPFSVAFDADGHVAQRKLGETSYAELAGWAQGAG
ncbi:MAG: TlpA family protein disulfide reductase [Methylibium sp.]|uniref:TlpA disulfide reductase family protein n=1 Tax=Methylibium sp. TaxID=2067992 RepID=UPI0017B3598A|nr:TlpA disulfide reductase family protein [Methylibium sp.]MBA3596763.1 TlpA family protein disulfide reductase [Methylibium sp.]